MSPRFEGTLRALGADPDALVLADLELSIDGGAPVVRRVRRAGELVSVDGRVIALELGAAALVGCTGDERREAYGDLESEIGELFVDVAPGPSVPVKLRTLRPRVGEIVVIEGRAVEAPAAGDYRGAQTARIVVERVRPRGALVREQARAASAAASAASRARASSSAPGGGLVVPLTWLAVVGAIGACAAGVRALVERAPSHPGVARGGAYLLAACALLAFLAFTRVFSIPNDGARWPGLGLVPELIAGKARDHRVSDVLAGVVAGTLGGIAAIVATIQLGNLARTGDLLLRERTKSGRQGPLTVDVIPWYGGVALVCVALLGLVMWLDRRRGVGTVRSLLGPVVDAPEPPLGAWIVLDGALESERRDAEVATYERRVPPGKGAKATETSSERPMILEGPFGRVRVPSTGLTWGSTFARTGKKGDSSTLRRWIPRGARARVAGRLARGSEGGGGERGERGEHDDDGLAFRPGGADAIVVFACAPARDPGAVLRARLWLHHATLIASITAIAYAIVAAIVGG